MRIFQPNSKRIRNAEKITLLSQENNINPNQKYKIDYWTELFRYRPCTKSLWNTSIPATSSFHYDRDFYLNIFIELTLPLNWKYLGHLVLSHAVWYMKLG